MSSETFTHDVFLSHSSKDKDVVRGVAERLRADGLKVWFDEWVLRPGDSIPAKIEEGLEQSRVLVLCMSANAFGSDWAQLEAGTFRFRDPLNKDRRFIPLRLDDAPVKGSLAQFLYINWFLVDRERKYLELLEACRHLSNDRAPKKLNEADPIVLDHIARLVRTKRNEWSRLRSDFEAEARRYHDVGMSVFYIVEGKPPRPDRFRDPNHAINLWQFYGCSKKARKKFATAKLTKFGITGAQISSYGLVTGEQTPLFCKMAVRAGGLLPDKLAQIITDEIAKKFAKALGPGKPILVSNTNPMAKWLNLMLTSTTASHPGRLKGGRLAADPFAASLTIFDYYRLNE